jgi:malate synthase
VVEGQRNLIDASERTISLDTGEKSYRLNDEVATLLVRTPAFCDIRVALAA